MEKTEENIVQNNNIQRHAFQVTINNPLKHGFNHLKIKKTLIEKFATLRYFCMKSVSRELHIPIFMYVLNHVSVFLLYKSIFRQHILKNLMQVYRAILIISANVANGKIQIKRILK